MVNDVSVISTIETLALFADAYGDATTIGAALNGFSNVTFNETSLLAVVV